jgi:ankyrin repeat protein
MTPLHYAALFSTNQICELLIAKGANKNAKSNSGFTPCEIAVNSGHLDLMKCLK